MAEYIKIKCDVRFTGLRKTVAELGRRFGKGGGSDEVQGERFLIAEVKKRFGADVSKKKLGLLYGSKDGTLHLPLDVDKVLTVMIDTVKQDPSLQKFVAGLPEFRKGETCRENAFPKLVAILTQFTASDDVVAALVHKLQSLTAGC